MGNVTTNADFPEHGVAGNRVFALSFAPEQTRRAFVRDLIDFSVELRDVVSGETRRTLVGISSELNQDYRALKEPVPLSWLIARFLVHHIATGDYASIAKPDGSVLMTTTYSAYFGEALSDNLADEAVVRVLQSWIRSGLEQPIKLSSLFASTNLTLDVLRRSINALRSRGLLTTQTDEVFRVENSVLTQSGGYSGRGTQPTPATSYYQEINIEAKAPFCFVIMPFGEHEHPQRQYFEVIKPLLDREFGITCYRGTSWGQTFNS